MLDNKSTVEQIFDSGELNRLKRNNRLLQEALQKLIITAGETTKDLIAFDRAAELDNAIDAAMGVLTKTK